MSNELFKIIKGSIPVLLSAPHNFPQIRNDRIKSRDTNTGQIVNELCSATGCWGIISTSVQKDPNWYKDSEFRIELFKLVTKNKIDLVLDVHGKKIDYEKEVVFYPNKTFTGLHSKILTNLNQANFINDSQLTICEHLNEFKISALEAEIRRDYREIDSNEYQITLGVLKGIIEKFR
ncbi:hypothetical protein GW755_01605 [bacterium]|nr:hypothetical protein [bacterium]